MEDVDFGFWDGWLSRSLLFGEGGFLEVGGYADYGVYDRGGRANPDGRVHAGLKIEVLGIDSYGGQTGHEAASGAADSGSEETF